MSKILAYPWQHSDYEEFDKASDRIAFCSERATEAEQHGMYQVQDAWKTEMNKHIPALIDRIKELETVNQVIAKEFRDLIFSEGYSCPLCGGAFKPGSPHEDDCPIAPEGGDT